MGEPSVQVSYMKQFAAQVRALGSLGEDVVAADPDLFAEIDEASRLTWLPVTANLRLIDALYAVLGPERARRFQAEQIGAQLDTPFWRSFVEGAVRLFGLDPGSLARWLPRTLAMIFRDCGSFGVDREDETTAVLVGADLPEALVSHPHWLDSVCGGLLALFDLCKTSGDATVSERDPTRGSVRITLRWKAPNA